MRIETGGRIIAKNVIVETNVAEANGGGFSVVQGSVELEDTAFTANKISGNEGGGGALFFKSIDDENADAKVKPNALTATRTTFEASESTVPGDGGFVHVESTNANFTDCAFNSASAKNGGAIYMSQSKSIIFRCNLTGTLIANEDGGAIHTVLGGW